MSKQSALIAAALVAAVLAILTLTGQFSGPEPTPSHGSSPEGATEAPDESPQLESSEEPSVPPSDRTVVEPESVDAGSDESTQQAQQPPRESRVPEGWAGYDDRAEKAAVYRAQKLHECYTNFATWEGDELRASAAKDVLLNAVFTIMDYERTSRYPLDETGYRVKKRDGYHVMMNGHGIYEWPVGQYPALDAVWDESFSGPLDEQQLAEIDQLYARAAEILAPYAE